MKSTLGRNAEPEVVAWSGPLPTVMLGALGFGGVELDVLVAGFCVGFGLAGPDEESVVALVLSPTETVGPQPTAAKSANANKLDRDTRQQYQ